MNQRIIRAIGYASFIPLTLKTILLRLLKFDIGPKTVIQKHVSFVGENIRIGNNCYINFNAYLYSGREFGKINICDNVQIGPNTQIITVTHNVGGHDKRAGSGKYMDVNISSGVWIGAGAIILPGVNLGEGCIVAAGSVVTKSVSPDTMVAGVPAVIKKHI